MSLRITRQMMTRSVLSNVNRAGARLVRTQEQISSGRRINRPSDDPSGTVGVIDGRARLAKIRTLLDSAEIGLSGLGTLDASLADVGNLLDQAKELAVQSANAPITTEDREAAGAQVSGMLTRLLQIGNMFDGERYLFGGHESLAPPFVDEGGRIVYRGDSREALGRVDLTEDLPLLLPGSRAFAVAPAQLGDEDLDPDLWEFTRLEDLRAGDGIATGRIRIIDGTGAEAAVSLVGATTVGEVIERINDAGLTVAASVNAEGNGLSLVDSGGGSITVEELDDGIAAFQLGIAGIADGEIAGDDLDPIISESTHLSLLRSGSGIEPGTITVQHEVDGALLTADVDLSFARTVGDLFIGLQRAEDASGRSLRIEGAVGDSGRGITIRAAVADSRLTVSDSGATTTATDLRVGGTDDGLSLFGVFEDLRDALRNDDQDGIESAIGLVDEALRQNLLSRVDVGTRVNRAEAVREGLELRRILEEEKVSRIEDTDFAEALVRMNQEQIAYEAALSATSRAISTSLIDFLR